LTQVQWGTVYVADEEIVPQVAYTVLWDLPTEGVYKIGGATTWKWGDANHDGVVNFVDVSTCVDVENGLCPVSVYACDVVGLVGCAPDAWVNGVDVDRVIDAYEGLSYGASTNCPAPPCAP